MFPYAFLALLIGLIAAFRFGPVQSSEYKTQVAQNQFKEVYLTGVPRSPENTVRV